MKIIDKTPLQDDKGEISSLQRIQGTLEHGLSWYAEMEAQKAIVAQMERVLEKGFTLIRNVTLANSQIVEPLILIGPPGVYVIHVVPDNGMFEAKGDQWNLVKSGRSIPARKNPMMYVMRLARALQVYLNRQGVILPGIVEPVLMSSNPATHIDSLRPMVRVVMNDAIRQFAASLLQTRPILSPESVYDIGERIANPRPKGAPPETPPEEEGVSEPQPVQPGTPSRARAIFHAAEESKPFDPNDLSFQYDESAGNEAEVPKELQEPSPSRPLPPRPKGALNARQWILLVGMVLVECCVIGGFAYVIISGNR